MKRQIKPPFLPPRSHESKYTLVLDLDETLIHYVANQNDSYFLVRPYCMEFLAELSKYYEIVVFTAGVQEYADWVIDQIDKPGRIQHRLYREHTIISQQERNAHQHNHMRREQGLTPVPIDEAPPTPKQPKKHEYPMKGSQLNSNNNNLPFILKDLSKIGRPLEKTIIVDNIADNFLLQKDNGIFIKSWYDDPYDTELRDLIPLLKQIVILEVHDVRTCLKDYRDQMNRII